MISIFELLAGKHVPPFKKGAIDVDLEDEFDWRKLPAELRYLAGPAERYARCARAAVDGARPRLTAFERRELRELSKRMCENEHYTTAIIPWLEHHPMTTHPEAYAVYLLCGLLDALDLDLR